MITLLVFATVITANVPLGKASHMAKQNFCKSKEYISPGLGSRGCVDLELNRCRMIKSSITTFQCRPRWLVNMLPEAVKILQETVCTNTLVASYCRAMYTNTSHQSITTGLLVSSQMILFEIVMACSVRDSLVSRTNSALSLKILHLLSLPYLAFSLNCLDLSFPSSSISNYFVVRPISLFHNISGEIKGLEIFSCHFLSFSFDCGCMCMRAYTSVSLCLCVFITGNGAGMKQKTAQTFSTLAPSNRWEGTALGVSSLLSRLLYKPLRV